MEQRNSSLFYLVPPLQGTEVIVITFHFLYHRNNSALSLLLLFSTVYRLFFSSLHQQHNSNFQETYLFISRLGLIFAWPLHLQNMRLRTWTQEHCVKAKYPKRLADIYCYWVLVLVSFRGTEGTPGHCLAWSWHPFVHMSSQLKTFSPNTEHYRQPSLHKCYPA